MVERVARVSQVAKELFTAHVVRVHAMLNAVYPGVFAEPGYGTRIQVISVHSATHLCCRNRKGPHPAEHVTHNLQPVQGKKQNGVRRKRYPPNEPGQRRSKEQGGVNPPVTA